ncbi:hypothetical protein [Streptomyces sp. NRRL F-2580]|uniref:SbtR family transcriptional regulator n=1 Tax=Streptomyces sp. NRRL F-2580 TaxID=1463841 RepID=UPI000A5B8650|nr:hypothetical protein [Streptomyces sp. NRRL F-2580]
MFTTQGLDAQMERIAKEAGAGRAMLRAIASLMDACVAAGAIRADIRPTDVAAVLEGIAPTSAGAEHRQQAEHLLDLTLDGPTVRR